MKPTKKTEPVSVLAIGAHPDDVEFGCGGVIAKEAQAGRSVQLVICSRGESSTHGTAEERQAEARRGAELLGASVEFMELGGDARLEATVENVFRIAAVIRRFAPRVVLAPSTVENQHPDHAVLGRMVRDAARIARYGGVKELRNAAPHSIEHLLYYAVTPGAEPKDAGRVLIDISEAKVMDAWRAAMAAHATQHATRDYVELQLTRARLNGLAAGVGHATALWPNDDLVFDSLAPVVRSCRRF